MSRRATEEACPDALPDEEFTSIELCVGWPSALVSKFACR